MSHGAFAIFSFAANICSLRRVMQEGPPPDDVERANADRKRTALIAVGLSVFAAIATVGCVFVGVLFFAFSICAR
jgi:hypothetical protein